MKYLNGEQTGMPHRAVRIDMRPESGYFYGMLFVHIGSRNPQKISAVKEEFLAVAAVGCFDASEVKTTVPEQPNALEDVIEGARGRAANAPLDWSASDAAYISVGLESGLVGPASHHRHVRFTMTCCAIHRPLINRENFSSADTEWIYGFSSGFTIPEDIMRHIGRGLDLSQATAAAGYTKSAKIGNEGGLISLLSRGRVTRRDQLREAVRNALFHLDALL